MTNHVKLLFFATIRERMGLKSLDLDVPDTLTIQGLKDKLAEEYPKVKDSMKSVLITINREYAFVTAIGQGTQSLVRITVPPDREVTIGSANCARTADRPVTYLCGASMAPGDYQTGGRCAFSVTTPRWECAFTGNDFVAVPFEAKSSGLALASRQAESQP